MLPASRLDALLARHAAVEKELSTNLDRDTYVKLSREFSELGPIVATINDYRTVMAELAGIEAYSHLRRG